VCIVVIGGCIWDDGLTEKVGITSEVVERGERADLFSMVILPFLGGIPRRPLDETELERVKKLILGNYGKFVTAVATGRGLPPEEVEKIAQGRVWMGGDAIARGLCDEFGTLDDAIQRARQLGGVGDWEEIQIVEYPPRPWIQWPGFGPKMPRFFGLGDRVNTWLAGLYGLGEGADATTLDSEPWVGAPGLSSYDVEYLKTLSKTPGSPVMMLPPDALPSDWQDQD
jgi:ClpP class serine protease